MGLTSSLGHSLGNLLGTNAQIASAEEINRQNILLSRENRDWQERMANTAHQRETTDLRAAGLNPLLSATGGGSGASTPQSSAPVLKNPREGTAGANAPALTAISSVLSSVFGEGYDKVMEYLNMKKKDKMDELVSAEKKASIAHTTALTAKAEREAGFHDSEIQKSQAQIESLLAQAAAHSSAAGVNSLKGKEISMGIEDKENFRSAIGSFLEGAGFKGGDAQKAARLMGEKLGSMFGFSANSLSENDSVGVRRHKDSSSSSFWNWW